MEDFVDIVLGFFDSLVTRFIVNPAERKLEENPETKVWRLYAWAESIALIIGSVIFLSLFVPLTVIVLIISLFRQRGTGVGQARQEVFDAIESRRKILKYAIEEIEEEKANGPD